MHFKPQQISMVSTAPGKPTSTGGYFRRSGRNLGRSATDVVSAGRQSLRSARDYVRVGGKFAGDLFKVADSTASGASTAVNNAGIRSNNYRLTRAHTIATNRNYRHRIS